MSSGHRPDLRSDRWQSTRRPIRSVVGWTTAWPLPRTISRRLTGRH